MKLALIAVALCASVGCSTIHVESDPSGAEVWVGSKMKGTTPCSFKLSDAHYANVLEVEVRKEGYLPSNTPISRYLTWYLAYSWAPTKVYAKLHKLEAAAPEKPSE